MRRVALERVRDYVEGVIDYTLSPTQISNARDCWRKWGLLSLDKIRVEQHPSAALGTDTHKQLEAYLNGGSLDYSRPSGYIAASGVQHLPAPKTPGMILEGKFKFQSPGGFWYTGQRDVFVPGPRPLVIDHKTTSALHYAKTEEELQTDPQAVIYAVAADAPIVDLKWVYYQTKNARKSLPVLATLERDHALEELARIEELTARNMVAIVELHRAGRLNVMRDLPPNANSCEKYGGCPFGPSKMGLCVLGPTERLRSIMNRWTPQKEQGEIMGLIDSLRANGAAAPATPPPTEAPQGQAPWASAPTPFQPATGVNPPSTPVEAAPEIPAPTASPSPPPVEELKGAKKSAETRRKKKEAEAAAQAAQDPRQLGLEEQAPVTNTVNVLTPGGFDNTDGYTLYIDCQPDKVLFTAEDLLYAPAKQAVNAKMNVPDYRLIEYGAGPGYLAVAVEDILKAFKGSHIVVSTQSQETHACLATLVKYASIVVRSTR